MAATVLASTLLLGACGNKNETTQTSSSAKTSQSSSSKAASSNKESKTQNLQAQLHLKRLRHLQVSLLQQQISHKRNQPLNQDKNKQLLVNQPFSGSVNPARFSSPV